MRSVSGGYFLWRKLVNWLFYFLLFLFGYITCRTFYFLRAARTSLQLIKVSQLISLGVLAKSMEDFHYASTYRIMQLNKGGYSDNKINSFKNNFEKELSLYKDRSIKAIINNHSGIFKDMIKFKDWNSAMAYLNSNRGQIKAFFLEEKKDDQSY